MEHIDTKAIILNVLDYTDSQLIVNAYTSEMGRIAFITSKKINKINLKVLLQPLFLVEISFKNNNKKEVQRINNLCIWKPYTNIPQNHAKIIISLFLSELLSKTFREQIPNIELFNFCVDSFLVFDRTSSNPNTFLLSFMIHLAKYLGFYPTFGIVPAEKLYNVNQTIVTLLNQLLENSVQDYEKISLSNYQFQTVLSLLIEYYQKNIPIGPLKSYSFLSQL